jgi:hypothetical protein
MDSLDPCLLVLVKQFLRNSIGLKGTIVPVVRPTRTPTVRLWRLENDSERGKLIMPENNVLMIETKINKIANECTN